LKLPRCAAPLVSVRTNITADEIWCRTKRSSSYFLFTAITCVQFSFQGNKNLVTNSLVLAAGGLGSKSPSLQSPPNVSVSKSGVVVGDPMVGSLLPNSIASSLANNPGGASGTMTMSSIPNSVQGVGLPSSMVSLICSTGIYRQVLFYARGTLLKKLRTSITKFPYKTVYFLGC